MRGGSRRRGRELEKAILAATLEELAEVGYARLTMERVALRAHTGKAALYRRWPGRAELVVDACTAGEIDDEEPPDTGSLRTDVLTVMRQNADHLTGHRGDVLRGLIADLMNDPEFARLVRERVRTAGPGAIRLVLQRAVDRGELGPWLLDSRRVTVATDLLRNHYLLYGAPIPDDVITGIVDDVYLPLLLAPPAA
ncbi:TetR/AcrR family transcriptional regulator [Actinospica sp. MGRD01-02]|uniref:TetR/AcrR family transcriptional regulator n=1 Tax=Actinospica acidithermotolerans TaxID=2828514 RepID=A0A941IJF8_9ACTN|nr:TetR/AcrR family transcriptional regulator [Actinospica acidithermotolerans]MBR7825686.1 TetR/AcrR family transcriptional regulator [Actinospica acidithermotolerans]